MIQVRDVDLNTGKLKYFFEDNKTRQNTIFLPDLTHSVNSCVQIMMFNGLTNSYALDFATVAAPTYTVAELAKCLVEFIKQQKLRNYQIVAAGASVWIAEHAILQYNLSPRRLIALDPDFVAPQVKQETFADYDVLVQNKKQSITDLAPRLDLQEYQQQMVLNAQVADFYLEDDIYQLHVSPQQQKEFIQSIPHRSFTKLSVPATLLMTTDTRQQIMQNKVPQPQKNSYAHFECYVIDATPHELLWYAPLTVLDFF